MGKRARRLPGGNLNHVVLLDRTVRRPSSRHTTTVHKLLGHLRSTGFKGAPEPLGLDEQSREILSYIPGRIRMAERAGPYGSKPGLVASARLLRAFHEASATFREPADANWDTSLVGHAAAP